MADFVCIMEKMMDCSYNLNGFGAVNTKNEFTYC